MIPSSYTIGNFKAIGLPQSIDLRPVTLIFGQNSAGKSSIIQSLLLCRFAMENGSFNFTSTKRWGQTIDLGGFRQYIHRHETNRDLTVGFTFRRTDIEKESTALDSQVDRRASARTGDSGVPNWSFSFFNSLDEISVEFAVGLPPLEWDGRHGHENPIVKDLLLKGNGEPFLEFSTDRHGDLQLSKIFDESRALTLAIGRLVMAYQSKLSGEEHEEAQSLGDLAKSLGTVPVEENAFQEVMDRVLDAYDLVSGEGGGDTDMTDLLSSTEEMARFIWILGAQLSDELKTPGRSLALRGKGLNYQIQPSKRLAQTRLGVILPPGETVAQDTGTSLGNAVEIEAIEDSLSFFCDDPEETDVSAALAKALRFDVEMLIDASLDSLRWWLLGTEYIGPYRSIPDRYFQIAKPETSPEVDQGYKTLRRIAENPDLLRRISNAFQDVLASPYRIEVRKIAPSLDFVHLEEEVQRYLELKGARKNEDVKGGVGKVIATVTEGRIVKGVYLVDTRNGTDVDFCDVGFGIGQVLPLVAEVASDRSGLVCIEQPEAHLHPKMQSDLADVFVQDRIDAAFQNETREAPHSLFILETHSEHLILRLLRRIRETTRQKLPGGVRPVDPNEISVAWVEAGAEGSMVTPLEINERGRFIDDWPDGFFEERLEEMF